MTSQEKLILKFLLTMLVIGTAVGVVRRTWFPHSLAGRDGGEEAARELATIIQHPHPAPRDAVVEKVYLNTASKRELMSLPGIGESLAERIILYREDYGAYGSVHDLTGVRGIGERTVERLKDRVTVNGTGDKDDPHD
ncbi:MAG: ComEA family DNA-binding protein [Fidelibacterota bacterium]